MKKRVVVTGLGVISPVGNDVASFSRALADGKSGISRNTLFDVSEFTSQVAGLVKEFNPEKYGITLKETRRKAEFVQYAIAASKQAVDDSGLDLEKENKERIGVLIGSGIGCLQIVQKEYKVFLKGGPSRVTPFLIPMLIVNEAAGCVAINFGFKGPNSCVATACASGSHALGDAFKIVQRGDADLMIAGGTEAGITEMGLAGFCALKALSCRNDQPEKASRPFDRDRDGFVMAEGAGLVVLEEFEHAKKRGAKIYAEFCGYGMSCDAYHITAPDPEGKGGAAAMNTALNDAQVNPDEIEYINAHGTSTKLNDKIETLAIKTVLADHAKKTMISSTKSMMGHLLGAAGGVEFIAVCLAIKDGLIPPTINYENPDPECDLDYVPNTARKAAINTAITNSLGFGGHNATLVVKKLI